MSEQERPICQNPDCDSPACEKKLLKSGVMGYYSLCTRCRRHKTKFGVLPTQRFKRKKGYTENRGLCIDCGVPVHATTINLDGNPSYQNYCNACGKYHFFCKKYGEEVTNQKFKTLLCSICGFTATHTIQLDIDHKDGTRYNNNPENLQCLCSNCHRLKGLLNGDFTGYGKYTLEDEG